MGSHSFIARFVRVKRIAGGLWALLRAITEILEELAPLAKHNAEIYQQATEALRQLSAKEAEIGKQRDGLEKDRAETKVLQESVSAEVAEARATMKADREAFDADCRGRDEALKERDLKLYELGTEVDARAVEAAAAAEAAQALKLAADEAMAHVVSREKELTAKVRGLRGRLAEPPMQPDRSE